MNILDENDVAIILAHYLLHLKNVLQHWQKNNKNISSLLDIVLDLNISVNESAAENWRLMIKQPCNKLGNAVFANDYEPNSNEEKAFSYILQWETLRFFWLSKNSFDAESQEKLENFRKKIEDIYSSDAINLNIKRQVCSEQMIIKAPTFMASPKQEKILPLIAVGGLLWIFIGSVINNATKTQAKTFTSEELAKMGPIEIININPFLFYGVLIPGVLSILVPMLTLMYLRQPNSRRQYGQKPLIPTPITKTGENINMNLAWKFTKADTKEINKLLTELTLPSSPEEHEFTLKKNI